MLVFKDDLMTILDVEETIRGSYNTSIYPGRYIKNQKGYWYAVQIEWGHLYRMRYAGQADKLNALVEQYQGVV